jgi:hypothetical protein
MSLDQGKPRKESIWRLAWRLDSSVACTALLSLRCYMFPLAHLSYHRTADDYPSIGLQPWMSLPSGKWNRK